MNKLQVTDRAPSFTAELINGKTINLKDFKNKKLHIAFHRYAASPICNLSLREFSLRYRELRDVKINYLVVFHSPKEKINQYYPQKLPFPVIADPDMKLYSLYGVKISKMGYYSPRNLISLTKTLFNDFKKRYDPDGDSNTMPADFFINEKGVIKAMKYGSHMADSWNFDDVLKLAY